MEPLVEPIEINADTLKRTLPVDAAAESDEDVSTKKAKLDNNGAVARGRKKMSAMIMLYSGVGYQGMQRNPDYHTIEGDLLQAMLNAEIINKDEFVMPGKIRFQRASKTDKSVSAAGQVCSMKLPVDDPDLVQKINSQLPAQIRVIDVIRTTKGFNSKTQCNYRVYQYLTPSFAFSPYSTNPDKLWDYRMPPETVDHVNRTLEFYKGTKNYFNFTSGRPGTDASCIRYMMSLTCSEPFFVGDDVEHEFVLVTIQGQSFMLHQIRKMIGLAMAVVRGHTTEAIFDIVFGTARMDIPKAPGLGLFLDKVVYTKYNAKFGNDGVHSSIDWAQYKETIEAFKSEHIFKHMVHVELTEQSMSKWLETLGLHTYTYHHPPPKPQPPPTIEEPEGTSGLPAQSPSTSVSDQAQPSSANPIV